MNHNPNCGGAHCTSERGEVRRLPWNDESLGGASILCRACFNHEIAFRRERNRELPREARYDTPRWEDVPVYETA